MSTQFVIGGISEGGTIRTDTERETQNQDAAVIKVTVYEQDSFLILTEFRLKFRYSSPSPNLAQQTKQSAASSRVTEQKSQESIRQSVMHCVLCTHVHPPPPSTHPHSQTHTLTHTHARTLTRTLARSLAHTHTHTRMRARTHTRMRARTQTYTHQKKQKRRTNLTSSSQSGCTGTLCFTRYITGKHELVKRDKLPYFFLTRWRIGLDIRWRIWLDIRWRSWRYNIDTDAIRFSLYIRSRQSTRNAYGTQLNCGSPAEIKRHRFTACLPDVGERTTESAHACD